MTRKTPRPWVLVTGASGGIGLELACGFARDGHPLVLTARSTERLAAAAAACRERGAPRVETIPLDLGAPEGAAALARREIVPGVLVNNAGYGLLGEFVTLAVEDELAMVRLNVLAVVELTKRLLPGILAAGPEGGVLNVASTAAYQPGPYMASYYATKAFVLSWSEALAVELAGRTRVTCLCPGPVLTGFQERAGISTGIPLFSGLVPLLGVGAVARVGLRAFRRGRAVAVAGFVNRAGAVLVRLLPRGLVARIVGRLQRRSEA